MRVCSIGARSYSSLCLSSMSLMRCASLSHTTTVSVTPTSPFLRRGLVGAALIPLHCYADVRAMVMPLLLVNTFQHIPLTMNNEQLPTIINQQPTTGLQYLRLSSAYSAVAREKASKTAVEFYPQQADYAPIMNVSLSLNGGAADEPESTMSIATEKLSAEWVAANPTKQLLPVVGIRIYPRIGPNQQLPCIADIWGKKAKQNDGDDEDGEGTQQGVASAMPGTVQMHALVRGVSIYVPAHGNKRNLMLYHAIHTRTLLTRHYFGVDFDDLVGFLLKAPDCTLT